MKELLELSYPYWLRYPFCNRYAIVTKTVFLHNAIHKTTYQRYNQSLLKRNKSKPHQNHFDFHEIMAKKMNKIYQVMMFKEV